MNRLKIMKVKKENIYYLFLNMQQEYSGQIIKCICVTINSGSLFWITGYHELDDLNQLCRDVEPTSLDSDLLYSMMNAFSSYILDSWHALESEQNDNKERGLDNDRI